jgi:murein DD-endopeptidase MepM/ murein hydrolase activator NlpD
LQQPAFDWASRLHNFYVRNTRSILLGVSVGLSVLGGGAYAVAELGRGNDNLREVIEQVSLTPLTTPTPAPALVLFRSDTTRSSDTVDTLLSRLGLSDPQAADYLRHARIAGQQLIGRSGRLVSVEGDQEHHLQRLTARWSSDDSNQFTRWVVERTAQGFVERQETAPLTVSARLNSGTIYTTLFAATDDANIPDTVATQMADIFSGDIDFHRALRKGDRFSVVYESLEADGEVLRTGRVLSAEFVNNGKTTQAFWFQPPGAARGGYYNADGMSLQRTYLASPLAFSRVTSGFSMRFHPILQTWRAHLGVDYAATTGTPVRCVGQGVVDFAGVQNGYGNVVMVKHANGHTTLYAHLSRIDVKRGQSIAQGQTLGAVGATGWATGPHLHFEFRVNGVHRDPLTITRQSTAVELAPSAKALFLKDIASAKVELAAASNQQTTRTE